MRSREVVSMTLGPIDVQQKTFGTALRGYDLDEVDDFLDEVVTTLKDYEQRLHERDDRIAELRATLEEQGDSESAIARALVAAQRSADGIVASAHEEAARIRAEAQEEAGELEAERAREQARVAAEIEKIRADARVEAEELEAERAREQARVAAEVERLRQLVRELRERVFAIADSVSEELSTMSGAIDESEARAGLTGVSEEAPEAVTDEEPDRTPDAGGESEPDGDEEPVEAEPEEEPEDVDLGDAWLAGADELVSTPIAAEDEASEEASEDQDASSDEDLDFFVDPGVDEDESGGPKHARRPWERD
jgi:cell division initiation protein